MEDLNKKWVDESKEMLELANKTYSDNSKNKVYPTIDSVGSIQAYVFGEQGIVSVTPCYDDQVAGKFATRLAYPEIEKILQFYSQKTGINVSDISMVDDNFIAFALELFAMEDQGWELTHASWNHSYSGYSNILYDTMQEAINSMYTDDVFCQQPERKSKAI